MSVPDDVLFDILSRLPAESVIRFRYVSKHWSFLTQTPDFIAAHLSRSNSNENEKEDDGDDDYDDDFSIVCSRGDEFTRKLVCISGADFMVRKEAEIPLKLRDGDHPQFECWPLCGSCNGILCVTHDGFGAGIALWNPAIGQVKLVPLIGRSWPLEFDWVNSSTGFGYDSKTNDYKILRLIELDDHVRDIHIGYTFLYSLATDSWKELEPFPSPLINLPDQNKVYINGVFYCHGQTEVGVDAIISFEMVDEKFHELAVPALHFHGWSIANWKGSLAFCGYANEDDFHIWVLNTDDESWTILHKITSSLLGEPIALGQRKHGELIFIEGNNDMILFDPQTEETRNLGNLMNIQHYCYVRTYTYKASLVTLKGAVELGEHGFCNMILDPYFLILFFRDFAARPN